MHLKIVNGTLLGKTAEVWIDGERAHDVTDVTVHFGVNNITTATITRYVEHLEVETPAVDPATEALAVESERHTKWLRNQPPGSIAK